MILQILHERERVEIRAQKMMTRGRLLGGAGGSGEACRTMEILQNSVTSYLRPAPTAGGAANLKGDALFRRPLVVVAIWGAWCLHFGTLGDYFGTSGAPWSTM